MKTDDLTRLIWRSKDARWLLCHCLGVNEAHLLAHMPHSVDQQNSLNNPKVRALKRFQRLWDRRLQGEPLAYLTGRKAFWTLDLQINKHCLVPRPETEQVVQCALDILPDRRPLLVADLGTGSGAIALSLAKERPQWTVIATDIDANALNMAQTNAEHHHLPNVSFKQGDWFKPLLDNKKTNRKYHAVISNPPYLPEGDDHLQNDGLLFEPKEALVSGQDGLNDLRILIEQASSVLLNNGFLILEHGYDQGSQIRFYLHKKGFHPINTHCDLNGCERVTVAQWNASGWSCYYY